MSLPKRWEVKITAISEVKDLKVLTLDELFGSLMTYELEMNSKVEEEEVKPKKTSLSNPPIMITTIVKRKVTKKKKLP